MEHMERIVSLISDGSKVFGIFEIELFYYMAPNEYIIPTRPLDTSLAC